MRLKFSDKRPAIAMIELIFALVIMGIVMMSAPRLIRTSTQSSYVSLQQESIAAAIAQMNMITIKAWDGWDTNGSIGEPVLQTASTVLGQCPSGAGQPAGVTSASGRYCLGLNGSGPHSATPTSQFGMSASGGMETPGYLDDIDDYDGVEYNVTVPAGEISFETHRGDYIDKNITISTHVYYGDDTPRNAGDNPGSYGPTTTFANPFRHSNPSVGTTNIKLIQVRLTTANSAEEISDKNISLSAFMCNVGGHKQIITNKGSL